jgi:hypothetical protein
MNLRHTAALALVGWYLMVPPLTSEEHHFNFNAPLAQWEQQGEFDTADSCHAMLDERRESTSRQLAQVVSNLEAAMKSLPSDKKGKPLDQTLPDLYEADEYAAYANSRNSMSLCIATDDPRLKSR